MFMLTRTHTHAHTCTFTHTRMLTFTHARSHIHAHRHTHMHAHTCSHTHAHTHTCTLIHTHARSYTHAHTQMLTCMLTHSLTPMLTMCAHRHPTHHLPWPSPVTIPAQEKQEPRDRDLGVTQQAGPSHISPQSQPHTRIAEAPKPAPDQGRRWPDRAPHLPSHHSGLAVSRDGPSSTSQPNTDLDRQEDPPEHSQVNLVLHPQGKLGP